MNSAWSQDALRQLLERAGERDHLLSAHSRTIYVNTDGNADVLPSISDTFRILAAFMRFREWWAPFPQILNVSTLFANLKSKRRKNWQRKEVRVRNYKWYLHDVHFHEKWWYVELYWKHLKYDRDYFHPTDNWLHGTSSRALHWKICQSLSNSMRYVVLWRQRNLFEKLQIFRRTCWCDISTS